MKLHIIISFINERNTWMYTLDVDLCPHPLTIKLPIRPGKGPSTELQEL